MTVDELRRFVLSLDGMVQGSHQNGPTSDRTEGSG
jgi:hypothetical protein